MSNIQHARQHMNQRNESASASACVYKNFQLKLELRQEAFLIEFYLERVSKHKSLSKLAKGLEAIKKEYRNQKPNTKASQLQSS